MDDLRVGIRRIRLTTAGSSRVCGELPAHRQLRAGGEPARVALRGAVGRGAGIAAGTRRDPRCSTLAARKRQTIYRDCGLPGLPGGKRKTSTCDSTSRSTTARRCAPLPNCGGAARAWSRRCAPSVHPRVCGELFRGPRERPCSCGSSPRVRGTPEPNNVPRLPRRFIPACAGNSRPRVSSGARYFGSSPRVRGTQMHASRRPEIDRFIPACAGNSAAAGRAALRAAVHPRVCGELQGGREDQQQFAGSSPRVRGTPRCATQPATPPPVHPRVCGELVVRRRGARQAHGSSPRVRGTLTRVNRQ